MAAELRPPANLYEALRWSAVQHPSAGVRVLDRRGRLAQRYSLTELLESSAEAGRRHAALGLQPGDPLVVALPTSGAWLESWFGALSVGALPVAMAPSSPLGAAEEYFRRLAGVFRTTGGQQIVCTATLRRTLADTTSMPPELVAITPEELSSVAPAPNSKLPPADPTSDAFLQLTSGTTSDSRVVRIRHEGAVHNARAIGTAIAAPLGISLDEATTYSVVSWLPLYHDMGLVGSLLTGIVLGLEVVLMPPQGFLGRPASWLRSLGGGGDSVTTAPNFGYQFCVEQLTDECVAEFDLSTWNAALVGAEMVRPETLEAFAKKFAAAGFAKQAFRPCYGLAEGTLAVTIDRSGGYRTSQSPGARASASLDVCLGAPLDDTEIWAASPDGGRLGEREVGEIHVDGPGVFAGYLNDDDATAESLDQRTLKTGDLGYLEDGELYVTGRLKEILVVRGQNLMPHEIEAIAESELGGGGVHRAACFTVEGGAEGEQIVLVAEAPTKDPETLRRIGDEVRSRIGKSLGLPLADLAFVAPGKLPRTTSGKVPRHRLRDDYLASRLLRVES